MTPETTYELLVIILDDIDRLPQLLNALHDAGVSGATLLNSIGGYRARTWLDQIGLSGLQKMFGTPELRRRTILAVMEEDKIDGAIAAAEQAVGGFGRENSGILFTLPVKQVVGVHKRHRSQESETLPATDLTDVTIRETRLEQVKHILNLPPMTIPTDASLLDAARIFVQSPCIQVAAVVSQTGHLLGLITLRSLANHFFFGVMPEVFVGEISTDIDQSMDFGKMANIHNVADAMIEPIAVRLTDTVGRAFALMHKYDLSGLPIIDDNSHVIGFISMQDLLNLAVSLIEKDH